MKFLSRIQEFLEDSYGAKTGLDVLEFVRPTRDLKELGKLLVEQLPGSDDLNIALLLDRDIFASFERSKKTESADNNSAKNLGPLAPSHRWLSVSFEEVSHFVYLSFNHNRGRNITSLELELQSEVDRILLAFHSGLAESGDRSALLHELLYHNYTGNYSGGIHAGAGNIQERYETARTSAADFVRNLCENVAGNDPRAWTEGEFRRLRKFFHSDLPEKLHLCRKS